jgi:hypothetical protein
MIAKNRRSPWVEGINVAGWIGVLLPPIWMLALIAAFCASQDRRERANHNQPG